jgi:hypothetical protein
MRRGFKPALQAGLYCETAEVRRSKGRWFHFWHLLHMVRCCVLVPSATRHVLKQKDELKQVSDLSAEYHWYQFTATAACNVVCSFCQRVGCLKAHVTLCATNATQNE